MKARIGLAEFLVQNSRIEEENRKEREGFLLDIIEDEIRRENLDYLIHLCENIKKANIQFTEILQKVETKGNVSWNENPYHELNNIAVNMPLYNRLEDVMYLYDLLAICKFEVENIGSENKLWSSDVKRYEGELASLSGVKLTSTTPDAIDKAKHLIPEYLVGEVQKDTIPGTNAEYKKCSYVPVWSAIDIPNSNGSVHIHLTIAILIA